MSNITNIDTKALGDVTVPEDEGTKAEVVRALKRSGYGVTYNDLEDDKVIGVSMATQVGPAIVTDCLMTRVHAKRIKKWLLERIFDPEVSADEKLKYIREFSNVAKVINEGHMNEMKAAEIAAFGISRARRQNSNTQILISTVPIDIGEQPKKID